jgi:hypothetical protein
MLKYKLILKNKRIHFAVSAIESTLAFLKKEEFFDLVY